MSNYPERALAKTLAALLAGGNDAAADHHQKLKYLHEWVCYLYKKAACERSLRYLPTVITPCIALRRKYGGCGVAGVIADVVGFVIVIGVIGIVAIGIIVIDSVDAAGVGFRLLSVL